MNLVPGSIKVKKDGCTDAAVRPTECSCKFNERPDSREFVAPAPRFYRLTDRWPSNCWTGGTFV